MNTKPRLTGEPIMRILCKTSENLVGYLYQWNNGDVQPAWFDGAMDRVPRGGVASGGHQVSW